MHLYLPEKYRSPISDTHLFAIWSLPYFSVSAHLCASHPFNCKCSVYCRLSAMISALCLPSMTVSPKCGVVWFIMNEVNQSFIFWILLRNYSLIDCAHRANTHQEVFYCRPHPRLPSSHGLSSHLDLHLTACSKRLIDVCSMLFSTKSAHLIKPHQWCCFYHPYSDGEARF